jgi:phosphatidylglycerol---prolipoprotein diacylglyceryl transferase
MHIHSSYKLVTLWGPFAINAYGLFIALGVIICMWLISFNKRYKQLHLKEKFTDIIIVSIAAGVIGGRTLEIISEPSLYPHVTNWFQLWEGGFSALGSILGVIIVTPFYLKRINMPVLPVFDLVAIYAPLFQAIARLGCLFAGCCYGIKTNSVLYVLYTNKETIAPYNIAVHPTQLYSSFILFFIFLYLFFITQHRTKYPGHIFLTYLMLAATERFMVDFLRADRIILFNSFLSFHQIIAIIIACSTLSLHFIQKHRN